MRDVSLDDLHPIAGDSILNLLRRCADGSLRMSADRWRLLEVRLGAVVFGSVGGEGADEQRLELPLGDIERMTWDRLPRQQSRSQLRFHLANGDLLTFSGVLASPPD